MLTTEWGSRLANFDADGPDLKAFKLLGNDNADAFISETTVGRRKAEVASSRGATLFNVATGVLHVVQIGVEVWMAITKVLECKEVRDTIKEAYNDIKPQEAEIDDLYATISEHYTNMSTVRLHAFDHLNF